MSVKNLTSTDYKASASINLWAAKIMRQRGDERAAEAHLSLADLYIKQELRRSVERRTSTRGR